MILSPVIALATIWPSDVALAMVLPLAKAMFIAIALTVAMNINIALPDAIAIVIHCHAEIVIYNLFFKYTIYSCYHLSITKKVFKL